MFAKTPHWRSNLLLYETTPFHDNVALLPRLVGMGSPCILFEDKALYADFVVPHGPVDSLFEARSVVSSNDFVLLSSSHFRKPSTLLICHGGMALALHRGYTGAIPSPRAGMPSSHPIASLSNRPERW